MARTTGKKNRAVAAVEPRLLILAILLLAGAAGLWLGWVGPSLSSVGHLQGQARDLDAQRVTAQTRIDALRGGAASGATQLLAQARALDAQLPADVDKTALGGSVPALAGTYGLAVTQMSPAGDKVAVGSAFALTFNVAVQGPADKIDAFLTTLSSDKAPSLMGVSNLDVQHSDKGVTATFLLSVYYSGQKALPAAKS